MYYVNVFDSWHVCVRNSPELVQMYYKYEMP